MALEYTKSADTKHKVTLDSRLIYAEWVQSLAYAGLAVGVEVGTLMVGDGAPVKIKACNEKGKKLGELEGTMVRNRFRGKIVIPEKVKMGEFVYFEVKLSKNGLSGESNRIVVLPAPKVYGLQWSSSEARRGDELTLTANLENVINETEVTVIIYEHDADGAHDKIVELPTKVHDEKIKLVWEYQYVDDTDDILTQSELEQYDESYNPPEYFFTVKLAETEFGKNQESGLLRFKDFIDLFVKWDDGTPISEGRYRLRLPNGQEMNDDLDEDGHLRIDDTDPGPFALLDVQPKDDGGGDA